MENGAAGQKGTKCTTAGPRLRACHGGSRTDMAGLALFCAVNQTERRLVLDQFEDAFAAAGDTLTVDYGYADGNLLPLTG